MNPIFQKEENEHANKIETWMKNHMHYNFVLVWTPCLMQRCVCIWWYILQNYNYKLHLQNLSIYHILPRFFSCMMPSMDEWRDGWIDGRVTWWKKLHEKWSRRPLLYVIYHMKIHLSNNTNNFSFSWNHSP